MIAADVMALAAWAAGTPAAMGEESMAVFEAYVLDGLAWMTVGNAQGAVWDWQVTGRRVAVPYVESEWKWRQSFTLPPDCSSGGQGCMSVAQLQVGLESAAVRQVAATRTRKAEWLAFADLLDGARPRRPVGNRQFWDSDYV